jgi:ribosomal protein L19
MSNEQELDHKLEGLGIVDSSSNLMEKKKKRYVRFEGILFGIDARKFHSSLEQYI